MEAIFELLGEAVAGNGQTFWGRIVGNGEGGDGRVYLSTRMNIIFGII